MRVAKTLYGEGGTLEFGMYPSGATAIQIVADDGELDTIATIDLSEYGAQPIPANCVWLKGWAENHGLPLAMEEARIVRLTGTKFSVKFGDSTFEAELAELTPAALAQRDGGL